MTTPMFIGRVITDSRRSSPDYRRLTLDTGHQITRLHKDCDWLADMRGHYFRITPSRYSPEVARWERLTFPMPGKKWKGKIRDCNIAGDRLRITIGVPDARLVYLAFAPLAETLGPFAMRQNVQVQADVARCMVGDMVKFRPHDDDAFMCDIVHFYVKRRRVRKPKLRLVKSAPPVVKAPSAPPAPAPQAA